MLYRIVRSPLSVWLAEHITGLFFVYIKSPGYPLWTALVRLLPACRTIYLDSGDKPVCVSLSQSADLKSSLRSITSLILHNFSFPSFRIVLRMLADITYLKEVVFDRVVWSDDGPTTADTARNVCTGAFSHVRSVEMYGCTNNTTVPAWIFAATSTRHSFTRRPAAGQAVPAETWAIIRLIRMFLDNSTLRFSQFDVKEATASELGSSLYQTTVLTRCC